MKIRNLSSWFFLLLLAATLLLSGCSRAQRLHGGATEAAPRNPPAASTPALSAADQTDFTEIDQLLRDLETDLKNTDTSLDLP